MLKRIAILCLLAAFVAAPVLSAAAPAKTAKGKITAIEGLQLTIVLEGDRPDWVKKNGPVKFKVGPGKILEVSAADVTPVTIKVRSKKAAEMKVDEVVTFEKGLSIAGC